MNWKHLIWIVPLSIFIGMVIYSMMTQQEYAMIMDGWLTCISELYSLNQ